ncbi:MAG: hypothetical protein ACI849_001013 [Patiriisocius sp.]|jgi:hypothetical protein
MNKGLFTGILLFGSILLAIAQQDILKESDWHIEYIILDGVMHTSPIINEQGFVNTNIDFEEEHTYALINPNGDSFFAGTSYNDTNMQFTFANGVTTLFGCEQYCDFESDYFELLIGDGNSNTFTYDIVFVTVPPQDVTVLTITNAEGDIAQYLDQPILDTDSFVKEDIAIYPNPTNDILTIDLQNAILQSVSIYNTLGELIKTSSSQTVNISEFPSGLYIAVIKADGKKWVEKIIKN